MDKKRIDEYGYGFLYNNRNHRLSHSHELDIGRILLLRSNYPKSGNEQNMYTYCINCKAQMIFINDGDLFKNHWLCELCKSKVQEISAYHQLERETEKYIKENELDGYGNDDYDEYYN